MGQQWGLYCNQNILTVLNYDVKKSDENKTVWCKNPLYCRVKIFTVLNYDVKQIGQYKTFWRGSSRMIRTDS